MDYANDKLFSSDDEDLMDSNEQETKLEANITIKCKTLCCCWSSFGYAKLMMYLVHRINVRFLEIWQVHGALKQKGTGRAHHVQDVLFG